MTTRDVTIGRLVAEGRLVQQLADKAMLRATLDSAERDVLAADANLEAFSPWSDAMLYEAGLRSARAIVQASGFRIDAGARAHVTTIDAADALTDGARHPIFVRLHRMRRRRNEFMYGMSPDPSASDLAQARRDALALLSLARAAVERIS